MTQDRQQTTASSEPMGIVISGGYRVEAAPTFWAYVWSDVPEDTEEQETQAAA
jgi:hypothetical protein